MQAMYNSVHSEQRKSETRDGECARAMYMELELFAMVTCDGEEKIAGNATVVGAVSGGMEISAGVRNRERVIQLLLELLAMERRNARRRAGNAAIA